jgi:DNA-directed RNA polymerase specialized sigma24 family protein
VENGVSSVTLDQMIRALVLGTPYNNPRFGREADRYARRITNRYASDLPEDFHEEVVHEAIADLMEIGAEALDDRSALALFRRAVINAIRTIRANYAPPGRRTRLTGKPLNAAISAEAAGHIPSPEQIEAATVLVGEHAVLDVDGFADPSSAEPVYRFEREQDAGRIMASAPEAMRQVLQLIYFDDTPIQVVAAGLGLSRFALHRRIEAFAHPWRLAA